MGLHFNRTTIFLMMVSAIGGFILNYWSTKLANDKLLASLQAQLATINQAQQHARAAESPLLEKKKSDLEAQIRILSQK